MSEMFPEALLHRGPAELLLGRERRRFRPSPTIDSRNAGNIVLVNTTIGIFSDSSRRAVSSLEGMDTTRSGLERDDRLEVRIQVPTDPRQLLDLRRIGAVPRHSHNPVADSEGEQGLGQTRCKGHDPLWRFGRALPRKSEQGDQHPHRNR